MPVIKAHVGAENRAEISKLEKRWKLGNADTVRRLVVLGLGEDLRTADALNAEMSRRRAEAQASHGRARVPGPRERARIALGSDAGPRSPTISVRLPGKLSARVTASGGLRRVVEHGIDAAAELRR